MISQPTAMFRDVVQYNLRKRLVDRSFKRTEQLNKLLAVLSTNIQKLQAQQF